MSEFRKNPPFGRHVLIRGAGRYEKLVVLAYIELAKILVVLLDCIIIEMPKVGGAIAPPTPPVFPPLD